MNNMNALIEVMGNYLKMGLLMTGIIEFENDENLMNTNIKQYLIIQPEDLNMIMAIILSLIFATMMLVGIGYTIRFVLGLIYYVIKTTIFVLLKMIVLLLTCIVKLMLMPFEHPPHDDYYYQSTSVTEAIPTVPTVPSVPIHESSFDYNVFNGTIEPPRSLSKSISKSTVPVSKSTVPVSASICNYLDKSLSKMDKMTDKQFTKMVGETPFTSSKKDVNVDVDIGMNEGSLKKYYVSFIPNEMDFPMGIQFRFFTSQNKLNKFLANNPNYYSKTMVSMDVDGMPSHLKLTIACNKPKKQVTSIYNQGSNNSTFNKSLYYENYNKVPFSNYINCTN